MQFLRSVEYSRVPMMMHLEYYHFSRPRPELTFVHLVLVLSTFRSTILEPNLFATE